MMRHQSNYFYWNVFDLHCYQKKILSLAEKNNDGLWSNGKFNALVNNNSNVGCVSENNKINGLPVNFRAKVLEIGPGDSLIVQNPDDQSFKRIFFSSTIFPKRNSPNFNQLSMNNSNKIFVIPYLFEARELLRTRYFGKVLDFHLDYIVEANNYAPERICCTVMDGKV